VSADPAARLRGLPSVDQLVRELESRAELSAVPRARLTACVRDLLERERRRTRADGDTSPDRGALAEQVVAALAGGAFSLLPVINATGVVLHTGLGRAVLSPLALERLAMVGGAYSNLEFDLEDKHRGSRYSHVAGLLGRLTGAEDALVVNNNAAAVLLALDSLARGREVVVSRGELIEIGGEFRIPDVMARSGARMREVGTTNRTHLRDYADAIGPDTALILKVHPSNYRVIGFTAGVAARDLVSLARERGVAVMEDLGSGSLLDLRVFGLPHEPTVPEVVASGVDLVSFSGDKLLGGPQAGIILGRRDLVARLRQNPLNRTLRIDKLTLAALEATLYAYEAGTARDSLPVLRMLTEPLASLHRRAAEVLALVPRAQVDRLGAEVREDRSQVGGGALPAAELPTAVIAIGTATWPAPALDARLRQGRPPVLGRITEDRLLLDCRTVLPAQVPELARALAGL
jgi:L-seryl-tRNA(Ser) seleniumtransferase